MSGIKQKLIRLGTENPSLQKHLRPIIDAVEAADRRRVAFRDDRGYELPIDSRKALVYFNVTIEEYNLEEDLEEGRTLLRGDFTIEDLQQGTPAMIRELQRLEKDAAKFVGQIAKARVTEEGHDNYGSLICFFAIQSVADLKRLEQELSRYHVGGEDQIEAAPYTVAENFVLYPQGVNAGGVSSEFWRDYILEQP